jgi:drug/metabolite transporter (DMT)-like permease
MNEQVLIGTVMVGAVVSVVVMIVTVVGVIAARGFSLDEPSATKSRMWLFCIMSGMVLVTVPALVLFSSIVLLLAIPAGILAGVLAAIFITFVDRRLRS